MKLFICHLFYVIVTKPALPSSSPSSLRFLPPFYPNPPLISFPISPRSPLSLPSSYPLPLFPLSSLPPLLPLSSLPPLLPLSSLPPLLPFLLSSPLIRPPPSRLAYPNSGVHRKRV